MKNAVKNLILITAVMIMLFNLTGCGQQQEDRFDMNTYKDAEQNTMLLDCFERVVGTPEEQPYYELVMYTYSDDKALLEEYADGGTEYETLTRWLIPIEAAQEMLDAVKDSGMADWNDRTDKVGITGKLYVCKFPDGADGCVRVSSESMPENGIEAFDRVHAAMAKWMKDEYLEDE